MTRCLVRNQSHSVSQSVLILLIPIVGGENDVVGLLPPILILILSSSPFSSFLFSSFLFLYFFLSCWHDLPRVPREFFLGEMSLLSPFSSNNSLFSHSLVFIGVRNLHSEKIIYFLQIRKQSSGESFL